MHFSYYMPTKVHFGCGEFEKAKVTGSLANDPAGGIPGIVEKIYNGACK